MTTLSLRAYVEHHV